MTPTERMAAVLALLRRANGRPLPSQELLDAVPDYAGGAPSGRRQYRRDLRALVSRGLVSTDVSSRWTPNRTGVKLRFIGKPQDWELSAREHSAVRSAAARHRKGAPVPTTDGRDRHGMPLDLAMDALRLLEEQGEWMTVGELAAELGQPAATLLVGMRALFYLDVADESIFDGVLVLDGDDEGDPAEVSVMAERSASSSERPLSGFGLDVMGRFAYTAAETEDRLGLIEAELADPASECDSDALQEAQRKLRAWQVHLATAEAPEAAS